MTTTLNLSQPSDEDLLVEYNKEFRKTALPITIIFGVEVILGIAGNLLTLHLYMFRYRSCNFRYFVLCLAFIDLISCLTTIPGEMVSQIYWFAYPVESLCHIKDFFNQFTVCSDAFCLTLIAVERYRKICRPFQWQIKQKTAMYACLGIYVVSIVLAIPTQVFWGVNKLNVTYKGRNITATICEKDEAYSNTIYPMLYTAINGCLVAVLSATMLVLYIFVVKQLLKRSKVADNNRQQVAETLSARNSNTGRRTIPYYPTTPGRSNNVHGIQHNNVNTDSNNAHPSPDIGQDQLNVADRVRRKTTIMLLLTIIFVLTILTFYVMISIFANGILHTLNDTQTVLYVFFLRLYFINHVINPVLYGLLDRTFLSQIRRSNI